jgi:predicted metal-dependent HD superfamily phosphohydrolase
MDRQRVGTVFSKDRFARSWTALGGTSLQAFDELALRYAEPWRAYHTAEHVAECLEWLDEAKDLCTRADEVELAIFFHDAVYQPISRASRPEPRVSLAGGSARFDNEAQSAALFCLRAQEAQLEAAAVRRVAALILGTASHHADDPDGAVINDIDLAILGAPVERFARYEADIRREYASLTENTFAVGRQRVLNAFLRRPRIYLTPFFEQRLEARARANLRHALSSLPLGS